MFDQALEGAIRRRLSISLVAGAAIVAGVSLWIGTRVAFGDGGPHVDLVAENDRLVPATRDGAGLARAIDQKIRIRCVDDSPYPLSSVATDNQLVLLRIASGRATDVVARLGNETIETIACDGGVHPLGLSVPEDGPALSLPVRFRLIETPRMPVGTGADRDAAVRDAIDELDRSARTILDEIGTGEGYLVAPLKARDDGSIGERWLGASVRGYLLVEG